MESDTAPAQPPGSPSLTLVSKWKAVRLVPPPAGPKSVKVLVPVLSFCSGAGKAREE